MSSSRLITLGAPVGGLLVICGLWQMIVAIFHVSPLVLPSPTAVLVALGNQWDIIAPQIRPTVLEAAIGLAVGAVFGGTVALVVTEVRWLRKVIFPLLVAAHVIPMVVLAPMFLIWFGFGLASKAAIAAVISFFPVVVNVAQGFETVPPEMLDLARSQNATRLRVIGRIRIPHAMPYFFTALRPAVALATIGAVVGEFLGGNEGLGHMVTEYIQLLSVAEMFGTVLLIVAIGLALYAVIEIVAYLSLRWHRVALRLEQR